MKMTKVQEYFWILILFLETVRGSPIPISNLEEICSNLNETLLAKKDLDPKIAPGEVIVNMEEIPTITTDDEAKPVNAINEIALLPEDVKLEEITNSTPLEAETDDMIASATTPLNEIRMDCADLIPLKDGELISTEIIPFNESEVLSNVEESAMPCTVFDENCNEDNADLQLITVALPDDEPLPEGTILLDETAEPDQQHLTS